MLPLKSRTEVRQVKVPYLVELRAPGGKPVYAGALSFDAKVLRSCPAPPAGWVSARGTPSGCTTGCATATRSSWPNGEVRSCGRQLTSPRRYA
ncbi:hypothetical protein ACFQV4_33070 [Streptomyces thermocarboxydus]